MLENYDFPDYPFFSGTGFFVMFPPYEYIFYITAKHCFTKYSDNKFTEKLKIPYEYSSLEKTSKFQNQAIIFSEYLTMKYTEQDDDYEDVLIFIVDNSISQEKKEILKERALTLQHQDDINQILNNLCSINGNIRTVGFPSTSKDINYDDGSSNIQPRGYFGKISKTSKSKNMYGFENPSWKENAYNGFSGSPILEIMPIKKQNGTLNIEAIPIGILLTATKTRGEFLSINVATDLIAQYIVGKLKANKAE